METNFNNFNEKINLFKKEKPEPIIEYKKENDKFYKRNPSGGKWVEITERQYMYYKVNDKNGKFTED